MPAKRKDKSTRSLQLEELKLQLAEAVETLEAIRSGGVDALVVHGPRGQQVFTLKGADQVYRAIVEAMNQGAVSLTADQTVLYFNKSFAEIVRMPLEKIAGVPFTDFPPLPLRPKLSEFLRRSLNERGTCETVLLTSDNSEVAVHLSANPVVIDSEVGVSLVVTDITQRKRLEQAQRELAKRIVTAQEQERYRVSRELHDGINQLLSSARHRFYAIEKNLHQGKLQTAWDDLATTRQLLERTIGEVRRISRNLRPSELDDLGLVPALHCLVEDFRKRNELKVRLHNRWNGSALEKHVELAVYRIVQEAFNNIERHARASHVDLLLLKSNAACNVVIRDNGQGFDPRRTEQHGFGLANMKERATQAGGRLVCSSAPGTGTEVSLILPV